MIIDPSIKKELYDDVAKWITKLYFHDPNKNRFHGKFVIKDDGIYITINSFYDTNISILYLISLGYTETEACSAAQRERAALQQQQKDHLQKNWKFYYFKLVQKINMFMDFDDLGP